MRDALTQQLPFALEPAQRDAWGWSIVHLRSVAEAIPDAHFFLEFAIPRMGRRADAIIVAGGIIFFVEYKVGAKEFALNAREQAHGYALDLKNFHETSHAVPIVPVLVSTRAKDVDVELGLWAGDDVHPPVCANQHTLAAYL